MRRRVTWATAAIAFAFAGATNARAADVEPPAVAVHVEAAKRIAGLELATNARVICMPSAQTISVMQADAQIQAPPPAMKVFDNLYFVGLRSVGAWIIKTSEGRECL